MGKSSGSAPTPPDPNVVAAATTQTNDATAAYNKSLNLGNNTTAFGSTQTTQVGTDPNTGAPLYSTNVAPNQQFSNLLGGAVGQAGLSNGINDTSMQGLSGLMGQSDALNQNLSGLNSQYQGLNSGISQLGGQYSNLQGQLAGINSSINPNAGAQAQQAGQNAAYAAQTQYLDPQFSQQQESLNNSLANQGLAPGSQAYNNAQLNQSNAKQQAYSNAANQAVLTGSTIGQQSLNNQLNAANTQAGLVNQQGAMVNNQAGLFGMQGSNLNSQAGLYGQQASNIGQQSNMYGQQSAMGQLGISNLGSIASLIPGYGGSATSSAAPADMSSLYNNQYQGQLAGYNAQTATNNSNTQAAAGLGTAAIMALALSDRRAKRAIRRVGTWANGLGIYTYRYAWEADSTRHIGFMADEVREIAPQAVVRGADGLDRVNYQMAA